MSELSKKVGQMLCIGFEGQECGAELRSLLTEVRPGGVIFFQRNIASAEQFRKLVADIREVLKDSRPFLAIDQEGGQVDRFRELLGPLPSAREAAQASLSFELGDLAGRELAAFGLNVDFAPVLDLGSPESHSVLGTRTAADTPNDVAQFGKQFVLGLYGWNILGCGKHFPGLGSGPRDSHLTMPTISKSANALWDVDLLPFRKLKSDSLMPMIMVAHATYPELEMSLSNEGAPAVRSTPASLSPNIVSRLLRERVGFAGLVVCDDLEMGGALEGRSIEEAAIDAVRAGSNLLLVCRSARHVESIFTALMLETGRDSDFRTKVSVQSPSKNGFQMPQMSFANVETLRTNIHQFNEKVRLRLLERTQVRENASEEN
jgi:beta-N-acetylhexosaminidase